MMERFKHQAMMFLKRGFILGLISMPIAALVGPSFGLPKVGFTHLDRLVGYDFNSQLIYLVLLIFVTILWGFLATFIVERVY